jgi:hypothetical protein
MPLPTRIGGQLRLDLSSYVSEWGELGGKAAALAWHLIGAPPGVSMVLTVGDAQWADVPTLTAITEVLAYTTPTRLTIEGTCSAGVAQIVTDLRTRAAQTAESAESLDSYRSA